MAIQGDRSTFKQAVEYDNSVTYKTNDIVVSGEQYYLSLINGNTKNLTDTTAWQQVAKDYTIDTFVEMFELSATDAVNVQRWKQLKALDNRNADEETEYETLTTTLAQKIVTSEDWNKLCDCIVNLQQMYVNKGLNEIETTIENYVQNYAEADINTKLGTMISNLLLTNATQIIISETTPTVVNGALWIKPKTT